MSQVVSFVDYTPAPRFDDIAWTQVRVQEGSSSNGPWTLIDTIALSPVDADPADPQPRDVTTDNASDTPNLWYRLTFVDSNGNVGQPSSPIQNVSPESSFATPDDLATRFGITLTDVEVARVSALLADASEIIRDEVGQKIGLVAGDVYTIPGTNDESIELPEHPVVSVASVTVDGTELVEGTDWYLDGDKVTRLRLTGTALIDGLPEDTFLLGTGAGFGLPDQTVQITYTHGYPETPGLVKGICLEMVSRVWVNPGSVARESVGDTQTVYESSRFSPSGLLLTRDEQQALKRFFGVRADSVTIGR